MNLFSFRGYNKKWKIEFFTSRMPKSLSFKWQLIVYSIVYSDNIVPLDKRGKSRSQSVMIHEYQYKYQYCIEKRILIMYVLKIISR